MFLSGTFNLDGARQADTTTEGESTKPYASIRSLEGRFSVFPMMPYGQNSGILLNALYIFENVFLFPMCSLGKRSWWGLYSWQISFVLFVLWS